MARKGWREIPIGGLIVTPGSATEHLTGGWRTERPVIDLKRCTHCLICWVFCPEGTIRVVEGKVAGVDLAHCKGCGICAAECPTKVISMVEEKEVVEGE